MRYRCPICGKRVRPPAKSDASQSSFFPFCSERCKFVDLGGWFDARYRIITPLRSQERADQTEDKREKSSGTAAT